MRQNGDTTEYVNICQLIFIYAAPWYKFHWFIDRKIYSYHFLCMLLPVIFLRNDTCSWTIMLTHHLLTIVNKNEVIMKIFQGAIKMITLQLQLLNLDLLYSTNKQIFLKKKNQHYLKLCKCLWVYLWLFYVIYLYKNKKGNQKLLVIYTFSYSRGIKISLYMF